MKKIWEIKQAAEPTSLDLYIYDDVEGDSYDWWSGETIESETSAKHFRDELAKYPDVTQINIFINSYGGSVFEGTAIYSQLKRHKANKTVYVDGFACSVAAVIAMAGDKVVMPSNTMMMIHNAWTEAWGNATQLRKAADDLDVIMEGNRQAFMDKAKGKITEEKLIELLEAESWLTAKQCLEYGFCDEVLGKEKDADLTEAKQMLQKVNKTLEQQISFHKAIAAQIRELSKDDSGQAQQAGGPKPEPTPEPQAEPENKILTFFNALAGDKNQ